MKVATHTNSSGGGGVHFVSKVASISSWRNGGADKFESCRSWLRQCTESHEECRYKKDYGKPTRLVAFDDKIARVVLTESLDVMPKYASLSYCWGLEPFTKLTVDNISAFLGGIVIEQLPKTFRDAMYVARKLGLSYIWIDALCIVQQGDDHMDWLTESGRMGSIYGGCHVTIAASSATSVHGGLFSEWKHYSGGFCARVTTTKHCTTRNFHSINIYAESSGNTALSRRAWTLQERLLSARVMYFGKTGIFWECRCAIKSEFLSDDLQWPLGEFFVRPEGKEWEWSFIVSHYTRAELSNPSDRLPALSGIARRQHEANGKHYLAGMWRERLVTQLAWFRNGIRKKRPSWRAPSWSWASIDSAVIYWYYWDHDRIVQELETYIDILDAWTTPSGPDAFGRVNDGLLSIACSTLVSGQLFESGDCDDTRGKRAFFNVAAQPLGTEDTQFPVWLDCLEDEETSSRSHVFLLPVFKGPTGVRRNRRRRDGKDSEEYGRQRAAETGDDWERQLAVRGLVLRACGGEADTDRRFFRVGMFDFANFGRVISYRTQEDRGFYRKFLQIMEVRGIEAANAGSDDAFSAHLQEQKDIRITIV
ncbi:hypothetical protein Cob_v010389 [Colletotrichum orbiculare MAFF 240422]|uniref:Heterokaryon incompatibility domain-containing protein n=1 Tax=Colletotrichum orbiculare (strain 104-T / ATCC 96160 / CBS 514.97 / LARS 414 / MAFF 240422) TaxID=1213857 RepID=A0A484FGH0_COLOR|nr:hypothetical protein Cob_v010389 [Colletotrichum orbiculare MAFF 240422]